MTIVGVRSSPLVHGDAGQHYRTSISCSQPVPFDLGISKTAAVTQQEVKPKTHAISQNTAGPRLAS